MTAYLTNRPAAGNVTEAFGPRPKPTPTSPDIHYGMDFGWGGGTAIYAARSGRVASYAYSGSYGNRLVIDHGDGTQTWYCHLSAAQVSVGDQVDGGQRVATMGATGNVTAQHLHFELRIRGVAVDPAPYFTSGSATAGTGSTPVQEADDMSKFTRIQSSARGIALIGPGYYRQLMNDEEVIQSAPLVAQHLNGNDRQFDLWVSMALGGTSANSSADADIQARVAKLSTQATVTPELTAAIAALEASLADDFKAIPGAVLGAAATRLVS